jgi:hypothetical protein
MYRGKDIGGREKLIQTCLSILIEGQAKKLYEVLPHISVVRSPLFLEPLLKLLQNPGIETRMNSPQLPWAASEMPGPLNLCTRCL